MTTLTTLAVTLRDHQPAAILLLAALAAAVAIAFLPTNHDGPGGGEV